MGLIVRLGLLQDGRDCMVTKVTVYAEWAVTVRHGKDWGGGELGLEGREGLLAPFFP